jgi:hypothetical protein
MRALILAVLIGWLAAPGARAATDDSVLLGAYLQTHLIHLVSTQIDEWSDGVDEAAGEEMEKALQDWSGALRASTVRKLNARFGGEEAARGKLSAFVSVFTQAEKRGDKAYIRGLSGRLKLEEPWPVDFTGLRQASLQVALATELAEASAFLGAVETWVGGKTKNAADLPELAAWLDAALYAKGPAAVKSRPAANPLADAEAGLGGFVEEESPEPNPFDDYRASRQAKRKRAMEQAREGMSAVAGERQAAESEAASKKLAAAQAEAAAMQKHAEKLAAVEQEALEQRKNSWSARLKNIVASTVSTATGVFFGSVGQRAGEAVTDAVFNDK